MYTISFPPNYSKPVLPDRDKLTAALRSGKFHQGRASLKRRNFSDNCFVYCCLGVLCELQGRLVPDSRQRSWGDFSPTNTAYLSENNPLYAIFRGLGYFPKNVFVKLDGSTFKSLADCNDNGCNFNEIADIIEAVWADEN